MGTSWNISHFILLLVLKYSFTCLTWNNLQHHAETCNVRTGVCFAISFLMDPYWRAFLGRFRQFSPGRPHYFKKLLKPQPECINVATHSPQQTLFWLLLGHFKWKTSSFFLFIGDQGFFKSKNLTIIRQKKKHWDSGRPFYQSSVRRHYQQCRRSLRIELLRIWRWPSYHKSIDRSTPTGQGGGQMTNSPRFLDFDRSPKEMIFVAWDDENTELNSTCAAVAPIHGCIFLRIVNEMQDEIELQLRGQRIVLEPTSRLISTSIKTRRCTSS